MVMGQGSLGRAQILATALDARGLSAAWMDAPKCGDRAGRLRAPDVDWDVSRARLAAWREQRHGNPKCWCDQRVVASARRWCARDPRPNGSDYSASIFAALSTRPKSIYGATAMA